jgi:hypothetical protein
VFATCACLMPCAAGGDGFSSVVDIFNVTSICPAGYFFDPVNSQCAPCQPGFFSPSAGSSSCSSCSPGSYSGSSGQSQCTLCLPGTYSNSSESGRCTSCSPGQYCPSPGSTKETPCDEGFFCPSGSSAPTPCPRGSFCPASASAATPCPQNTYGELPKLVSESQCARCPFSVDSGIGAVECSLPCIPSPWNVNTFQCYSTEGKVIVVLTWCASLFSAVFFPFKVWSAYKYRRGKLEAKGVRPTLKHLIFFHTALARAVSLQPLIGSAGGVDYADVQHKLLEQEQRMKEHERAIAALQQSASPPTPSAHRDDA